jgi:hypothetical protein
VVIDILGIAGLVWLPLVVALVLVVSGWIIAALSDGVNASYRDRMGVAKWSFSESWASTLTASGAILGTILAAQLLPDPEEAKRVPKDAFIMLNLMFGVIIVIAKSVYNTFRFENNGEYEGFVGFFLVASTMVLWAVLGQLLALWYLLDEITFPSGLFYATFKILLVLAGTLAGLYGVGSIPWTLRNHTSRPGREVLLP